MTVFDANTYGPDEVPVDCSYVLIDTTGDRKFFAVGFFDHEFKQWELAEDRDLVSSENIRWSFLPLAVYDTNPELRKTIKL